MSVSAYTENNFLFLPLGGTGEIGMNFNLYAVDGQWIAVDCGIDFPDGRLPGIEVYLPDPTFIKERKDDLLGLFITHGHEDHIGAIAALWPDLGCPIYASPFTAKLVDKKLDEAGLRNKAKIYPLMPDHPVTVGGFTIDPIRLTHSMPEPSALAIKTRFGSVLHTGDWRFDDAPLLGEKADLEKLEKLGDEGVLALIGDSTNVFHDKQTGTEQDVRDHLTPLIKEQTGRVAVTCFASNLTRVQTIALAAQESGRHLSLIGRSLDRLITVGKETGYLKDFPEIVPPEEAAYLPNDKLLYLCTGSQGEYRAGLWRISEGTHPHVTLEKGDTVIFSSKTIPGNEMGVSYLHNRFAEAGVRVVTEKEAFIHVSGHASKDDVRKILELVRPQTVIPVHGEQTHLAAHEKLAEETGCEALKIGNGDVIALAGEGRTAPTIVDTVDCKRLIVDGRTIFPERCTQMRFRKRMAYEGALFATIMLDSRDKVSEAVITVPGLLDDETQNQELEDLEDEVCAYVNRMSGKQRRREESLREAVRIFLQRHCKENYGKKPLTIVHLVHGGQRR